MDITQEDIKGLVRELGDLARAHYDFSTQPPSARTFPKASGHDIQFKDLCSDGKGVDEILPPEWHFLSEIKLRQIYKSGGTHVLGFRDGENYEHVLRLGGDGLNMDDERSSCPIILPANTALDLGTRAPSCEIVPFAGIIRDDSGIEIDDGPQQKIIEHSYTLRHVIANLLRNTPWEMSVFLDFAVLSSALPVLVDPGHIMDTRYVSFGSDDYQEVLMQMHKNQRAMNLPKELQWVRRDDAGIFHPVVRDQIKFHARSSSPINSVQTLDT